VRIEIETALGAPGLDVVPVLVNGARMPRANELPESLHPLLRRHAATIRRDPDFRDDVDRLSKALRESVRSGMLDLASLGGERKRAASEEAKRGGSSWLWAAAAALVLALGGYVLLSTGRGVPTAPAVDQADAPVVDTAVTTPCDVPFEERPASCLK
jgi:hypothetical protein